MMIRQNVTVMADDYAGAERAGALRLLPLRSASTSSEKLIEKRIVRERKLLRRTGTHLRVNRHNRRRDAAYHIRVRSLDSGNGGGRVCSRLR